jgi:outer membrane protein OmpA-like peptidoglycan-associated protein
MSTDLLDPFQQKKPQPKKSWDDVFVREKKGGGGGGKRKAASSEADLLEEAEFLDASVAQEPEPPPKPAVKLFNPKWGLSRGVFDQAASISVEATLPEECKHLTRVTFTVNALLPNGKTERIDIQEGHLEEGVATAEVTLWKPMYVDPQGKPLAECEYAFTAKHRDAEEVVSPDLPADCKDRVHRVRLSGMLFDANKSFILPQALDGIKKIVAMHGKYAKAQVLLVGHAGGDEDLSGSDIAFDRAQMLNAYLKGKPNLWLNQFDPGKGRSRWGTREIQLMLSVLPEGGQPFYAGNASGVTNAATTAALKAFQEAENAAGKSLPADGKGDFDTRQALVEAYMALNGTTLAEDVTPIAHGVEGHFEDTATESGAEPDDRRLEAFFFEAAISPLPSATTSAGGASPYPKWIGKLADTEDFGHHGIHVQIVDAKRQPVPFAEVKLSGPTSASATSDEHGFVSFTGLKPGEYVIASEKNGYKVGASKLKYPTAKTVPGHVAGGPQG